MEDLVRHFVVEPWVAHLDFSRMEQINTKFHSEALERRDGDIIMRIPFLDDSRQKIYLFLLLEFQSTEDPWMALRFGTYVHLLYEQLELKFGPLPQWAQERIARADAKAIEAWAANLFNAETLEAVFEPTS